MKKATTKTNRRLTPKQYLKMYPEKYILSATVMNDETKKLDKVYVSEPPEGSGLFAVGLTSSREKAIVWSSLDHTPAKLQWHQVKTGLKNLEWEQLIQE